MPLPLRDYVQQVLLEKDRASHFHRAIQRAWTTSVEKYPERSRWRRKSTFRGLVWEEAVRELAKLTEHDTDFRIHEHRDTASFIIEDSVLFRFKHADLSLGTSNVPTFEASSFDDHEKDLYGFTGHQRVEICYILNEFETSIIWIGVSAREKGQHLWKIELSDAGVIVPVAELDLPEPEVDLEKLLRLKGATDQDKNKKKDDGAR